MAGSARQVGSFRKETPGKGSYLAHYSCVEEPSSCTAIFFVGDNVDPSGDEVIERLSEPSGIASVLISKLGPTANTLIVKPSRYEGPFACFDGLLNEVTRTGEPLGYKGSTLVASQQILALLCQLAKETAVPQSEPLLTSIPNRILLFGFSKGGVVLNQVLAEVAYLQEQAGTHFEQKDAGSVVAGRGPFGVPEADIRALPDLMHRICGVHYIDAGLNCRGAYMTDPQVLKLVKEYAQSHPLRLTFHGTPRQWEDRRRPWLSQEKDRCIALLKGEQGEGTRGIEVGEKLYFAGQRPSLAMHFRIIEAFEL